MLKRAVIINKMCLTSMHNWFAGTCHEKEDYRPCFSEGCFLATKMCDGYNDCGDWSDESDCKFILHHFHNYILLLMPVTSSISCRIFPEQSIVIHLIKNIHVKELKVSSLSAFFSIST
jgi:hypothetical protein